MLLPDIIIPYDGTNASIPDGWTRDTRFDGKYVKATTSSWETTGGATTHTHTNSSHTHSYSNNGHVHNTGTISAGGEPSKNDARHQDAPPWEIIPAYHTHNGGNSGGMSSISITSATASVGTASNEQSRYHYIFIKSTKYNFYPSGAIILRNDTSNRAGASHFTSGNGRYIKGASTGADAGNATDVTTHSHSQSHSHTLSHSHDAINSGAVSSYKLGGLNIDQIIQDHSHTVYFTQHQEVVSNSTSVTSFTNNLAYKELHHWKATSNLLPIVGDIAFFTGSTLPNGWSDLGLSNVYIRGKSVGSSLTTGGALTHTHSDLSHSHSGSSHTHSYTTSTATNKAPYKDGGSSGVVGDHSHYGTTGAGTNASTSSTSITFSTTNYEPEYINVRLIKMDYLSVGGSIINSFVN